MTPRQKQAGKCILCGHRGDTYHTELLTLQRMAWVCEDPIRCLRRRKKARG